MRILILKLDNMLDTMVDAQDDPKPTVIPESPEDSAKALLMGKVDEATLNAILALFAPATASDEDDDKMTKEEVKGAMDSLRKELLAAEEARRFTRIADLADALSDASWRASCA